MTGYGLGDRMIGVRFPAGGGNFSLHHRVQTGSEAHPASYPVGTGDLSLRVKRPGREADHSPLSSAEVKECVELYLHSPIRLHGVVLSYVQDVFMPWCLVKYSVFMELCLVKYRISHAMVLS
jgi:hypothetical protein